MKYKNVAYSIIGFILIIFLWTFISIIIDEQKLVFPGPLITLNAFIKLLSLKSTYLSIFYSLFKMIVGYGCACLLALILGILAGLNKWLYKILHPLMLILKSIPTAALIFLFIVMAGFNNSPIFVVILVSFPILYEAFYSGIKNIPNDINDVISLDGGSSIKNIINVRIPFAKNYIILGITSSFALAFKVEIMAEVLSGATIKGIGCSIKIIQATTSDMSGIFAWSMIAVILLLIITYLSNLIKKHFNNQ